MPQYVITGRIEQEFQMQLEANSEEDAEDMAERMMEDGDGNKYILEVPPNVMIEYSSETDGQI